MAAMSATLTRFSAVGNAATYTAAGHVVQSPRLVLMKRKIPGTAQNAVASSEATVLFGTIDSAGQLLSSRIAISASARIPVNGTEADVDSAIALFRDFVAADEFVNLVKAQLFVS